jgi:hypothetical protein
MYTPLKRMVLTFHNLEQLFQELERLFHSLEQLFHKLERLFHYVERQNQLLNPHGLPKQFDQVYDTPFGVLTLYQDDV